MELFLLIYAYMYHGDVEPMFQVLTGIEGPNHDQITTSVVEDWPYARQIFSRRPMPQLVHIGRNILAMWYMLRAAKVHERPVHTTLNLSWWLLCVAIKERHAKPDVQIWMDDLDAEWNQKAGGNFIDRYG